MPAKGIILPVVFVAINVGRSHSRDATVFVKHLDYSRLAMSQLIKPSSWREIPIIIADAADDELLRLDRDTIIEHFKLYGVVLFRHFSVGVEKLQDFVKSFSTTQISYPGNERKSVSADRKVQTVPLSVFPIQLHSELSHTPFRPDICWFYCVTAPTNGSETILCDGSILASALPASTLNLLENKMLRYRMKTPIAYLERLLGIEGIDKLKEFLSAGSFDEFYKMSANEVRQDFVAPALHRGNFVSRPVLANNIIHNFRPGKPLLYPIFADGSIIPESVIRTIRDTAQHYTFEVKWRDHDLLMFDNTRFMHGRRAIIDTQRLIWTQFSDVSF